MDALDDLLRRTADAVARHRVPETMITVAARSLTRMPADGRREVGTRALVDAVLNFAASHPPCEVRCEVCEAVANGLAVALGAVRAEVDIEMERKLG